MKRSGVIKIKNTKNDIKGKEEEKRKPTYNNNGNRMNEVSPPHGHG